MIHTDRSHIYPVEGWKGGKYFRFEQCFSVVVLSQCLMEDSLTLDILGGWLSMETDSSICRDEIGN